MTDLQTILHDLSQLLPERFKHIHRSYYVMRYDSLLFAMNGSGVVDSDRICGACQKAIEAKEWWWTNQSPVFEGDPFRASVNPRPDGKRIGGSGTSFYADADSPTLALATALRDAIRAEQTKQP